MAKLIVKQGSTVKEYPVDGVLTIGRQSVNTIKIIAERASRRHARIMPSGSDILIEDLNSANGTLVNGRRITRCVLKPGDVVKIGDTTIIFQDEQGGDSNTGPSAAADPLIGRTLNGYHLLSRIGQGGMGTVYKARQLSMDRLVALKVLKKELADNRDFVKRFLREARVAGRLTHPVLIQVHDFGEADGILYFSMEFVDGETVRDILKREGKISPVRAVEIAAEITAALVQAAHHKVVHQDIKPQNIMIDRHKLVKLADLGLASIVGREDRDRKRGNVLMGTPHYMAPEQSKNEAIDARTDIYALGATLFHMVTGRVPFDGPNTLAILTKHITYDRPDIRQYDITQPPSLARLVQRMMAVEPDDRPANAAELAGLLTAVRADVENWEERRSRKSQAAVAIRKRASRPGLLAAAEKAAGAPAPSSNSDQEQRRREIAAQARAVRRDQRLGVLIKLGITVVALIIGVLLSLVLFGRRAPDNGGEETARSTMPVRKASNGKLPDVRPKPSPKTKVVKNTGGSDTKAVPSGKREEDGHGKTTVPPHPAPTTTRKTTVPPVDEVLKAKDRLLTGGDFSGAEKTVREFETKYPDHPERKRLEKALAEITALRKEAAERTLRDAAAAIQKQEYRLAVAECTRLLSTEAGGEAARRARKLLMRIDVTAKPLFDKLMKEARSALQRDKPNSALAVLGRALDALGGTKWGREISVQQFRLICARRLLQTLDQAVKNAAKPVVLKVRSLLTGREVTGRIEGVIGLSLQVALRNTVFPQKLSKLSTAKIKTLLQRTGLSGEHARTAALFSLLERRKDAEKELAEARRRPDQVSLAARLTASLNEGADVHTYDFNHWRQLDDWTPLSGVWAMADGRYLLESTEGGDTALKESALGGGMDARNAQIGFVFEPLKAGKDFFISAEFGKGERMVEVFFSPEGCRLKTHLGGGTDDAVKAAWEKRNGSTRVELRFKEGKLALFLDGKQVATVNTPGAVGLRGTVTLRVRGTKCAFDDFVLRGAP